MDSCASSNGFSGERPLRRASLERKMYMVERSLRWYVPLFLLCLWMAALLPGGAVDSHAQTSSTTPEEARDVPSMVISETRFDFGEVDEGSEVSHDFIVRNNGKEELQITKVSPD